MSEGSCCSFERGSVEGWKGGSGRWWTLHSSSSKWTAEAAEIERPELNDGTVDHQSILHLGAKLSSAKINLEGHR